MIVFFFLNAYIIVYQYVLLFQWCLWKLHQLPGLYDGCQLWVVPQLRSVCQKAGRGLQFLCLVWPRQGHSTDYPPQRMLHLPWLHWLCHLFTGIFCGAGMGLGSVKIYNVTCMSYRLLGNLHVYRGLGSLSVFLQWKIFSILGQFCDCRWNFNLREMYIFMRYWDIVHP